MNPSSVFSVRTKIQFEQCALKIFKLQAEKNLVYKQYLQQLGVGAEKVKAVSQIPFLPIEFFKTHEVITKSLNPKSQILNPKSETFKSSGTTGSVLSKHHVQDISLYEKSFRKGFESFYGDVTQYAILALLPSYYENKNSSLLYMMMDLIKRSKNKHSAFYNSQDENSIPAIQNLLQKKQKVILFGVSFALLDLVVGRFPLVKGGRGDLAVIETGGMKGRKEEITRGELHKTLCAKFGVKEIHSEYGMTELLSQAYSKGDGIFKCPPWMKVLVRDVNDPFSFLPHGKPGALNIIDLANIHSCSFIATQDVGKIHKNGSFEVLGRMDNSDLRGCNLLAG